MIRASTSPRCWRHSSGRGAKAALDRPSIGSGYTDLRDVRAAPVLRGGRTHTHYTHATDPLRSVPGRDAGGRSGGVSGTTCS